MEADVIVTTEFDALLGRAPLKSVPQLALDLIDIVDFGDGKDTAFEAIHDGENSVVTYEGVSLEIKGPKARAFLRQIITDRYLMGLDPEAFRSILRAKESQD